MKYNGEGSFWNSFTSQYQMGPQKHRLYLLNLLKEKSVTSILDVGGGTMPIYELLREMQWDVKYRGTDYAPAMVNIARDKFPDGDFKVEDMRQLDEEDNSWDCVLLMHSLDHTDDYKKAIKEAARVSNKYVCIVLWRGFMGEGTHLNDRNMINKNDGEEPWEDTHLQEYSKEALAEAFEEAGLGIVQTAEGDTLNSDNSHYNFLYLLRKEEHGGTLRG